MTAKNTKLSRRTFVVGSATAGVMLGTQEFNNGGNLQDPEGVHVIAGPDGALYMAFTDATQDFVGVVMGLSSSDPRAASANVCQAKTRPAPESPR